MFFLYKHLYSAQKAFINLLELSEALFMMDSCFLLRFKISIPIHCHYKDCISLKVNHSKSRGNFNLRVNYPFNGQNNAQKSSPNHFKWTINTEYIF